MERHWARRQELLDGREEEQWVITHRETKFSELPGTEGSATVSIQSAGLGLPV